MISPEIGRPGEEIHTIFPFPAGSQEVILTPEDLVLYPQAPQLDLGLELDSTDGQIAQAGAESQPQYEGTVLDCDSCQEPQGGGTPPTGHYWLIQRRRPR